MSLIQDFTDILEYFLSVYMVQQLLVWVMDVGLILVTALTVTSIWRRKHE